MNISKLKPIKIESQEALEKVERATKSQSISNASPKTFDPNFPIFSFETNNKHLVYVPNFFEEDADGNKHLIKESAYVHAITKGRQFMFLRATHGLQGLDELGISGDSPLQQAVAECWELYNLKYQQVAKSMGVDPNNDVGEVLKPKRSELLNQRVIKDPDLRHYFPIVVFETEKDPKTGLNTFKFVLDAETKLPKYEIKWMDVSDSVWNDKWVKVMDSLDEGDCLAGKLLSLNYHFSDDISNEKNPRRDSGKALSINVRQISADNVEFFAYLDEQAKEWTPAKAREVIIACALLSDEQQQEIVDDIMQETRMELNSLKALELGVGAQQSIQAPQQSPENALAEFGTKDDSEEDTPPLNFG